MWGGYSCRVVVGGRGGRGRCGSVGVGGCCGGGGGVCAVLLEVDEEDYGRESPCYAVRTWVLALSVSLSFLFVSFLWFRSSCDWTPTHARYTTAQLRGKRIEKDSQLHSTKHSPRRKRSVIHAHRRIPLRQCHPPTLQPPSPLPPLIITARSIPINIRIAHRARRRPYPS